jgi:TonB family protein
MLLNAGIGGTVTLQFVIEADGTIQEQTVKIIDATHDEFRNAAVQAIQAFRFTPGRYRGENVRVLIQMPLTWQVP